MYCNHCGAENPDSARYCRKCGMPLHFLRHKTAWPVAPDDAAGSGMERKHILVRAGPNTPSPASEGKSELKSDGRSERPTFKQAFEKARSERRQVDKPEEFVLELHGTVEKQPARLPVPDPIPVLDMTERSRAFHPLAESSAVGATKKTETVQKVPPAAPAPAALPPVNRNPEPARAVAVEESIKNEPSAKPLRPKESAVHGEEPAEDLEAPESSSERAWKLPAFWNSAALSLRHVAASVIRKVCAIPAAAGKTVRAFKEKTVQKKKARAALSLRKKERLAAAKAEKAKKTEAATKVTATNTASLKTDTQARTVPESGHTEQVSTTAAKQKNWRIAVGIFHRPGKSPKQDNRAEPAMKMPVAHVDHDAEDARGRNMEGIEGSSTPTYEGFGGLAAASGSLQGAVSIPQAVGLIQYIFDSSLKDDDPESWGETPENLEKKRGVANLDRRKVMIMVVATLIGIAVIYFSIVFMFPQNGGGRIFG